MIHPASEEFGSAAELQIRFHECGVAVYSILPPDLIFYMDNPFRDELAMIVPAKPMLLSRGVNVGGLCSSSCAGSL
jgi:hypothetical protein